MMEEEESRLVRDVLVESVGVPDWKLTDSAQYPELLKAAMVKGVTVKRLVRDNFLRAIESAAAELNKNKTGIGGH